MADLITYVADRQAMRDEGAALAVATEQAGEQEPHPLSALFSVDEDGGLTFNVTKIPVTYSADGNQSLCLVRGVDRSLIEQSASFEILGEVQSNEYVFDSDEARAKYESVYDVSVRTVVDEDGNEHEYTPPYMMGLFA